MQHAVRWWKLWEESREMVSEGSAIWHGLSQRVIKIWLPIWFCSTTCYSLYLNCLRRLTPCWWRPSSLSLFSDHTTASSQWFLENLSLSLSRLEIQQAIHPHNREDVACFSYRWPHGWCCRRFLWFQRSMWYWTDIFIFLALIDSEFKRCSWIT